MRKTCITNTAVAAALLAMMIVPVSASNINDTTILSIEIANMNFEGAFARSSVDEGILYYTQSDTGYVYGPEDYVIDNNDTYLLNSSNNTIHKYVNGSLDKVMSMDSHNITATHIAAENDAVYVIDNNQAIYSVLDNQINKVFDLSIYNNAESISDFFVQNEKLYVTTPETEYCKTYVYDLSESATANNPQEICGRVIGDGISYYTETLHEDGSLIGDKAKLVITYPDQTTNEVVVMSEYGLVGVQLVGITGDNKMYVVVSEVCSDNNHQIVFNKTLRLLDCTGNVEQMWQLPDQEKSIANHTKYKDGKVYQLNTYMDKVDIVEIEAASAIQADGYVSPLSNIETDEIHTSEISLTSVQATITRDDIIDTAESYRREFSWSCVADNLVAMNDWVCPSYVTGAGTYTNMPYCWGGWDNHDSFVAGLAGNYGNAKGRVGNATKLVSRLDGTYGLDCSGYVCQCWEISPKISTSMLDPDYSENDGLTEYINITEIQRGDALNKAGVHIMLVSSINLNTGKVLTFECTTDFDYDKVVYIERNWESLTSDGYVPIRCTKVAD